MTEYYPTLLEMAPWHKKHPVTWMDGWHIFRGPKIGNIAPDGYVVVRSNEPKVSLHHLVEQYSMSGMKFFIILFDGTNHGDTTQDTKSFADEIDQHYGNTVECFVITKFYDTTRYDIIDNILWDIDTTLEQKYGASWQSIYVLDRDKKIVRKSCGFMKDALNGFLQKSMIK